MKYNLLAAAAVLLACSSAALAQGATTNQKPPVPTAGADNNGYGKAIARDPGEVQSQQGRSSGASPGTVGAAPGADTRSQRSKP